MTLDDLIRYRLSRNQRIRAFTVLVVSFTSLGCYYLAVPKWNEYQEAQAALMDLESRRPVRPHQSSDVKAIIEDVRKLDDQAKVKRDRYPIAENVSTLLIELEKLTREQDIKITSFMPTGLTPFVASTSVAAPKLAPASSSISLLEQGVEIKAIAKFPKLLKLLQGIERYHHPLSIQLLEVEPDTKTASASLDPSANLTTRLLLSAYLLEKSPQFPVGGANYEKWLSEAQAKGGVANPFLDLVDTTPPVLIPAIVSLPSLPIPGTPEPVATPDPITAWKVEGILTGPGRVAIVSNGAVTKNLQIGDTLEGWRVQAINSEAVVLVEGRKRRTLTFPKTVLPEAGE